MPLAVLDAHQAHLEIQLLVLQIPGMGLLALVRRVALKVLAQRVALALSSSKYLTT
jgi:hypothetical protein